jgi:predicted transcriptional regulator
VFRLFLKNITTFIHDIEFTLNRLLNIRNIITRLKKKNKILTLTDNKIFKFRFESNQSKIKKYITENYSNFVHDIIFVFFFSLTFNYNDMYYVKQEFLC